MKIYLNDDIVKLAQSNPTLKDLIKEQNIPEVGTALAINDRIIPRDRWDSTELNELDKVVAISAAFGG